MNEWGVVGVIVVLIGLIISVISPILKLNTTITKLTAIVDSMSKDFGELTTKNTESHRRIWDELDSHAKELHEHDKKIEILEHEIK